MAVSPATRPGKESIRAGARARGRSRVTVAMSRPWPITTRTVLCCLGVIALADLLIWRWKVPYGVEALFDEPAHLATGLVALAAAGVWFEAPIVLAVVAGSLLIDLDHIPHVFGSNVLEQGIPRPYTHSLGSLVVLVAVALLLRGNGAVRRVALVVALALGLHFFRDTAEPGGPGVSLLWPVSDHAVTVGYAWYGAAVAALVAIALARRRNQQAGARWPSADE
jgi:membrane-bound metal-dependent hydrolase YbcI (DUF457 family)